MADYPNLQKIGFHETSEIERYTLRQEGDEDVLKIHLKRDKGEWLSRSRKFKFKRYTKTLRTREDARHRLDMADASRAPNLPASMPLQVESQRRELTEAHPTLLKVIDELDTLVADKKRTLSDKTRILNELEHLEKVVVRKIADLREQIQQLK